MGCKKGPSFYDIYLSLIFKWLHRFLHLHWGQIIVARCLQSIPLRSLGTTFHQSVRCSIFFSCNLLSSCNQSMCFLPGPSTLLSRGTVEHESTTSLNARLLPPAPKPFLGRARLTRLSRLFSEPHWTAFLWVAFAIWAGHELKLECTRFC